MAGTVRDVMTTDPLSLSHSETVLQAARAMRDHDIGAMVVMGGDGKPCGLVTDRDLAIRTIADVRDPASTPLGDICSRDLTSVSPDTPIEDAIRALRGRAIRRLPVMEGDRVVGIVTLGDLAMDRDPNSVLAEISAAPANT
jgi:CBS domain-containing protein